MVTVAITIKSQPTGDERYGSTLASIDVGASEEVAWEVYAKALVALTATTYTVSTVNPESFRVI